ncbi:MAG: hypothetical protein GPJ52_01915 [Candidatus Heimdallarchaeota archaeon]|nr:hypothetical protein [Candidatus Heimdallarchaeota archaeon]
MIDVNEKKRVVEQTKDKEKQYRKCLEIIKQKCWSVVKDKRLKNSFLKVFAGELLEYYEQGKNVLATLVNVHSKAKSGLSGSAKEFSHNIVDLTEVTGIGYCAFCKYEILEDKKNKVVDNRRYHPTCYQIMKNHTQIPTKKSSEGDQQIVV